MNRRTFFPLSEVQTDEILVNMSADRNGKPSIQMHHNNGADICFVSPACITQWPRCTGDGNYGTMWGPSDLSKSKYTLDLTDHHINGETNKGFDTMATIMENIDEKLLEFVFQNQLKILGRKNLSKEECKMLQIRTVRAKYDKNSGVLVGHSIQLNTAKYTWDGMGGKYARKINICDHRGNVIEHGTVAPGDVVAATVYMNTIYTGVGGDKFGISWSFDDVSVICQRAKLELRSQVPVFAFQDYTFAVPYDGQNDNLNEDPSFSEPVIVT